MAVPVLNPPKSILWVDDEGELLEPHRIFLRSKGYTVEWASNADDAIELLRRRPFDILLLDEQMPGKRGLEVFREDPASDSRRSRAASSKGFVPSSWSVIAISTGAAGSIGTTS